MEVYRFLASMLRLAISSASLNIFSEALYDNLPVKPGSEHLSPTHNLSPALIAGLPAKLNSTQLRRQICGQCLAQIMCRR